MIASHALAPDGLRDALVPIGEEWGGFAAAAEGVDVVIRAGRDEFNRRAKELFETDRRDDFNRLVDSIRSAPADGDPPFFFLHTLLPYSPWEYLPSGSRYGHLRMDGLDEVWEEDPWLRAKGRQRHLLQTAYVDHAIGQVLDALEDTGRYEDALIVVTADHGVTFEVGNDRRTLDDDTIGDIAMMPLFIKYPRSIETGIVDDAVESVDIVPTILEVFEADNATRAGRSLLAREPVTRSSRPVFQRGEVLTIPASAQAIWDAPDRKVATFGHSGGLASLYRFGPHADVVGRSWDEFTFGGDSDLRAELGRWDRLADVDPEANRLPVHLTGIVDGVEPGQTRWLALALNGRVEAVAKVFTDAKGVVGFAALVPENALRPGRNLVEIAEITAIAGDVQLRPVPITNGQQ